MAMHIAKVPDPPRAKAPANANGALIWNPPPSFWLRAFDVTSPTILPNSKTNQETAATIPRSLSFACDVNTSRDTA